MASFVTPSWVRIILLTLSPASFIPQFHRIAVRGDCDGISLAYVLLNALVFTEELVVALFNVLVFDARYYEPPRLGGWLDFVQCLVVWLCSLGLFATVLTRSSHTLSTKAAALCCYIACALVLALPVVVPAAHGPWAGSDNFVGLVHGIHTLIVNPVVTILGTGTAAVAQGVCTAAKPSSGALSPAGLAAQAVVFALAALGWPWRLRPRGADGGLVAWYRFVGWPCVHDAFYAICQAALWWIAKPRMLLDEDEDLAAAAETEPLLRSQATMGAPASESQ
ncbi:hypothetical protein F4780DRAFT_93907 [Xylariomycetidae sp. FL0641]|nr:hypothetical protein F4780DRAFT_93907 [Xylariomycetidae sp. FL0641]